MPVSLYKYDFESLCISCDFPLLSSASAGSVRIKVGNDETTDALKTQSFVEVIFLFSV